MTSTDDGAIPWGITGKSLENLLSAERKIGHYEHASYDLLSAVAHDPEDSVWRRFLLEGDNFASVVNQVLTLAQRDAVSPKAALDAIKAMVEGAHAHGPEGAASFLGPYLAHRVHIPAAAREFLDHMVKEGKKTAPARASVLAAEVDRLRSDGRLDGAAGEILDHWYDEIARGNVSGRRAREIPAQLLAARDRLLFQLQQDQKDGPVDEDTVFERYSIAFKSNDIAQATELAIALHRNGLQLDLEQLRPFRENLSIDETFRRLDKLGKWMKRVNGQNHDGVTLTPVLMSYLAAESDFDGLLDELDRLREETRHGRFRVDNLEQRDMEFLRFASESWIQNDDAPDTQELYQAFKGLPELSPPREEEFHLDGQHLAEVKRVAFEAAGFLEFLREFRAGTDRPIVVVGNDRYGRQWVVEPLEEHLRDDFIIRYDRVPSHASWRLRVPRQLPENVRPAFPREFVREINAEMPHVVIVDSQSPRGSEEVIRLSRATRDYANWFVAFNDLRAQGDICKYEHESGLPPYHIPELKKWFAFVVISRQLSQWVTPGPTYKISHWAPILREQVMMGDFLVARQDPDIGSDRPQVILTNPAVYPTDGEDVPDALEGTRPYYFDGPERYVKEKVLFGFGPHGFETRVEGHTTETFVAEVQRHIRAEIDLILKSRSAATAIERPV